MIKRIAFGALLAATAAVDLDAQTAKPTTAAAGPVKARDAAGPQIGTFGFDEAGMDRSVGPGDSFYNFASGGWSRATPVPADKSSYGAFDVLADLSRDRTRGILQAEQAKGSKLGQAYAAYLDIAAIEAKGLAPAKPWLDKIKGLSSKAGYPALAAEAARNGVGVPFGGGVGQDAERPADLCGRLEPGGAGAAGSRLLPVRRSQARRGQGRISGAYREDVHARRRAECGGPRQGHRRFRDGDRARQLDPHRQPQCG
jgi:putative endopeptidase